MTNLLILTASRICFDAPSWRPAFVWKQITFQRQSRDLFQVLEWITDSVEENVINDSINYFTENYCQFSTSFNEEIRRCCKVKGALQDVIEFHGVQSVARHAQVMDFLNTRYLILILSGILLIFLNDGYYIIFIITCYFTWNKRRLLSCLF